MNSSFVLSSQGYIAVYASTVRSSKHSKMPILVGACIFTVIITLIALAVLQMNSIFFSLNAIEQYKEDFQRLKNENLVFRGELRSVTSIGHLEEVSGELSLVVADAKFLVPSSAIFVAK